MRQAGAEMIALVEDEHLGLVGEPAERGRMDDSVAVPPEGAAAGALGFGKAPAAASRRIRRKRRAGERCNRHGFELDWPMIGALLTLAAGALNYQPATGARMPPGQPMTTDVTITDRAARKIGEILKSEPSGAMLRLSVLGGGCSGFQYKFDVERDKAEDDVTIVRDGVTMLVDSVSLQYLAGSEVDFVDDLIGASFKVNNPKAKASCGCGTSFSL